MSKKIEWHLSTYDSSITLTNVYTSTSRTNSSRSFPWQVRWYDSVVRFGSHVRAESENLWIQRRASQIILSYSLSCSLSLFLSSASSLSFRAPEALKNAPSRYFSHPRWCSLSTTPLGRTVNREPPSSPPQSGNYRRRGGYECVTMINLW